MERDNLAQYYRGIMQKEEREHEMLILNQRKRELKHSIKTIENYKEILEEQLEAILDRIDYLTLFTR